MGLQVRDQRGRINGLKVRCAHHVGFHQRAARPIGLGNDSRIDNGWMLDQAVFDFTRADPVARRLEYIVAAPLVPQVSLAVAYCQITRSTPISGEFTLGGSIIFPVAEKENRIGLAVDIKTMQCHFADDTAWALLPRFIDDREPVAGVRHSHAAGLCGIEARRVPNDVIDLCLAEHFVHGYPQLTLAVPKNRIAHGLACAHDGL